MASLRTTGTFYGNSGDSKDDDRVSKSSNTWPHPPPQAPLTLKLAGMVTNGRKLSVEVRPPTVTLAVDASDDPDVDLSNDSRTDDESKESELDNSLEPSSSSNDDDVWNEDEMNDILNSLLAAERRPLQF